MAAAVLNGSNDVGSVHTHINYYSPPPDGNLPPGSLIELITGDIYSEVCAVDVQDVKDNEGEKFNIHDNGFEYIKHHSENLDIDYYDNDVVREKYYPETEELVKRLTGAKSTQAFQHVFRHATPAPCGGKEGTRPGAAPLSRAHIDLSIDGARTRLSMHTKDEEELNEAWNRGFMLLSVWRPLETVKRDALCVMDTKTLPEEDMVAFTHPAPFKGNKVNLERVTIKAPAGTPGTHQWYYYSDQTPDDVLLIKFCDSRKGDSKKEGCPHTSFEIPGTEDLPARKSIETRVMAFF